MKKIFSKSLQRNIRDIFLFDDVDFYDSTKRHRRTVIVETVVFTKDEHQEMKKLGFEFEGSVISDNMINVLFEEVGKK